MRTFCNIVLFLYVAGTSGVSDIELIQNFYRNGNANKADLQRIQKFINLRRANKTKKVNLRRLRSAIGNDEVDPQNMIEIPDQSPKKLSEVITIDDSDSGYTSSECSEERPVSSGDDEDDQIVHEIPDQSPKKLPEVINKDSGTFLPVGPKKKTRTIFSKWQLEKLEAAYRSNSRFSRVECEVLREELGIEKTSIVRKWFMNRRYKELGSGRMSYLIDIY